ncbi:hypothetical protein BHE97_04160 [Aeromicrobium sp. PE09-221]|uniref:hypothetical protein n=1 Tax=Aeromicrobium sp. PE09-221 TaxID=1898043 RepID=UPI000B3EE065|nr:hypothetical protein [Aeromicrobium sp. PE09-221]OUZ11707.1 hypothetical protein BHE97_04160 [Aeromicrobium sp. PE09-221]
MSDPLPGPAPHAPTGFIDLTLQGSAVTATPVTPSVRINGYPTRVSYGTNRIAMPPGRAFIEVDCQWMLTYGRASIDVEVPEHGAVPVFYAPPYHQFTRGAIGHQPQKRRGLAGVFGIIGAIVLVLTLLVLIAVL